MPDISTVSRIVSDASQDARSGDAPRKLLEDAFARFERIAISFSGAEDVVLIDMASSILGSDVPVFTLDTGRLHPETYRFIEAVRERYGIDMEVRLPNAAAVGELVQKKGLFSFYRDGHQECCAVRKIQPLREKLAGLDAWVTGQRRDQGTTRAALPAEQVFRRNRSIRSSPHLRGPWSNSIHSPTGTRPMSGRTSTNTMCPTTLSTIRECRASDANPALAPSGRIKPNAMGAGGGRTRTTRNVVCTRRTSYR